VDLHPLDRYLLDGRPAKADAIAAALAERTDEPKAQPFYRALERLGARAADEALLALRLVLARETPSDEAIIALRELRTKAQAGDAQARAAYLRTVGVSGE